MSWLRVESATVAADLAEGLEARIADPLWMLARQWQSGEFTGDDAANPLLIQVEARSVRLQWLVPPIGHPIDLAGPEIPLEPLVEREPVRTGPAAARVATDLGRLLIRTLSRAQAPGSFLTGQIADFAVRLPPDDGLDPTGRRRLELLARHSVDGVRLAAAIAADPGLIDDLLDEAGVSAPARRRITQVVSAWQTSTAEVFSEPDGFSTWDPQRLEYRFALEATDPSGSPVRLTTGDGYPGGRLDWFSFDIAAPTSTPTPIPRAPAAEPVPKSDPLIRSAEVLPAPVEFRGMPAARFWQFEQGEVYFGGIETAPEDLARVAVAAYGTVYGDDWFMLPIRIPFGTLTEITRLTVIDDFGGRTTIPAAAVVDGGAPTRAFKFFELAGDRGPQQGRAPLLFLPPTVETTSAARPLEDVAFLRDEMANLAWAVEQRIQSNTGRAVDPGPPPSPGESPTGSPAAEPSRAEPPGAEPDADDRWRFQLSTPMPDQWVPLVPVRLTEVTGSVVSDGTIMFQRGRTPLAGQPGASRGARGQILTPEQRLLIHEEEIPRSGIRVVRRFESARDAAGRLHTWVGRRKGAGRGEGDSGLRFDVLDR